MAIDTINEKLALMEETIPWEPGLPMSPGTIGQDDQQQLIWGYPGILWGAPVESARRPREIGFFKSPSMNLGG